MDSRKGRRKSASPGARIIASPPSIVRREEAAVTLKGWLYKQGSDGLQLWKKRWFVLSEFCLFYYKGPNEDKVSGSILLPSYIISPLSKDDGIYRKYAFKAEHANMRTYYFAAETKDGMLQWMNSLSLASILQNENKLRPELLARELARQGALQSHLRHYQGGQGQNQAHRHLVQSQLLLGLGPGGETRQPLYANAPPKPKRVANTSRDEADYTPDPSPERPHTAHTPVYPEDTVRHRMPQERRTPEAYGRSKFEVHHNGNVPQKDYEEVYNNGYSAEQGQRYNEEIWQYNNQQQQSARSLGRQPEPRVPRPHSADFLEYEAEGVQRRQDTVNNHSQAQQRQQPQRPKSCIGEKSRPEDFWSEEVYAQKMRESAGWQYDGRERPQSRGAVAQPRHSMARSSTAPALGDQGPGHPLQLSPTRHSHNTSQGSQVESPPHYQLPPPAFYQDKSPRGPQHGSTSQGRQVQGPAPGQVQGPAPGRVQGPSYREDGSTLRGPQVQSPSYREDGSTLRGTRVQSPPYREDKSTLRGPQVQGLVQGQVHGPAFNEDVSPLRGPQVQAPSYREDGSTLRGPQGHVQGQGQSYMEDEEVAALRLTPGQYRAQQEAWFTQQREAQERQTRQLQQQTQRQPQQPYSQQQFNQQQQIQYQQQMQYAQEQYLLQQQQQQEQLNSVGRVETRITAPPSFPHPAPRKQSAPHTPTMYQNIPTNSRAYSDPRPPVYNRLESVTPNPRSSREALDSDNSRGSAGDFRRSASARLPRNKDREGDSRDGRDSHNHTFTEESGDSNRSGDQVGREESMKRLLEWKQRMLQSPLTRKSSRNASRTQTPTNSDSPVPSLNNDEIRKKVLEELQTPSTPNISKERRLARKGSSGSRSSRSRSSPRIAANKSQIYSSDEDEPQNDPRASRKRTKSANGRSRNSSSNNSRRNSVAKGRSRSRSASLTQPASPEEQPEYININSLKSQQERQPGADLELPRTNKMKPPNAIGPDDWYRDDFDFDKSHPFLDDPMLLKQYAQILDMKYRDSSTERIEEILKQGSLMDQAHLERSLYGGQPEESLESHKFGSGRYPDSGYDTLKFDLHADRSQLCVDIEVEEETRRRGLDERKGIQSWHSSTFADFQLMDRQEDTVFLSIEGRDEELENTIKRSPRDRAADKMEWQVGKSYKDLRREKEAPPKNVVKERLKSFESSHDVAETTPPVVENRTRPNSRGGEKFKIKGDLFKHVPKEEEESSDADDKVLLKKLEASEKKLEHKRSVKDLLSDFEKKSKALLEKEEGRRVSGIGSYLLQDSERQGGRRVFSDTETLMYGTSSEDEQSEDELSPCRPPNKVEPAVEAEPEKGSGGSQPFEPPPLPPKRPPPSPGALPGSPAFHFLQETETENGGLQETPAKDQRERRGDRSRGVAQEILNEETYLTMTPSKSLSSLPSTPGRKTGQGLLGSAHNSRTSLTSSHSSITSSTQNLGSMTPTEALIHSSTASVLSPAHSRTPSQSLVMEHFGLTGRPEETYVDMHDDGSKRPRRSREPVLARQGGANKESLDTTLTYDNDESPRYHEIGEKSHYELLCNARTAMVQHQNYEVVYQEIAGEQQQAAKPSRNKEMEPLRPIEGLPDILGNAPTNKGNSSSDADDESSKDFDALETVRPLAQITLDDSFRPASFYLSHCKTTRNDGGSGDSSDSDLVSPPPVPSSPPPMEEVLGYPSPSDLEAPLPPNHLSNVLSAAKSAHAQRERSRRPSQDDSTVADARRPSVSSRTSLGSRGHSEDSLLSPGRLHGSQQSLGSRELPPLPTGSQQSLASREVQATVGGRGSREVLVISPFHSREGSLDNETFLRPSFTHSSLADHSIRSTSAELSSSDAANYEQEYRRYNLENIQEVSHTLERTESGGHNISQELPMSYDSVYDSRLQQSKVYKLEDHPVLQKRKSLDDRQQPKYFQPDPHSAEIEAELHSPRSKVPYYVSDLEDTGVEEGSGLPMSGGSLGMVEVITQSMNALDVESRSYFEEKNQVENDRIKMLRRSYTPDPYLTKNAASLPRQAPEEQHFESNNVSRSKSLEGLLGDSPGVPKANLGYAPQPRSLYSPQMFTDSAQPARGYHPPPPPAGMPPLDIRDTAPSPAHSLRALHMTQPQEEEEDVAWTENLRRASLRQHRAASTPPSEERRGPPPTAPKPKTPVHFQAGPAVTDPAETQQSLTMSQPQGPHRNSVAQNNRQPNFLEQVLPTHNNGPDGLILSTSRPSSRGVGGRGGPRQSQSDLASKSMTLPARIKYSQDTAASQRPDNSFDSMDNSPRTRTSKSGLPEDAEVVPPSPRGPPATECHSLGRQHRQRDADDRARARRRNPSGSRTADLETLRRKLGGNLANITAGDLLGKSHEELVLILIQLRRQATSLTESLDSCRAELDNMRNTGEQGGELRHHAWTLEEQLARLGPVISLVDNMVKLGTLQNGRESGQPMAVRSQAAQERVVRAPRDTHEGHGEQGALLAELQRVQAQLAVSHRNLGESGDSLGRLEQDLTGLTRQLNTGANRQAVEARMREVQTMASEMQRRRLAIMRQIQELTQAEDFLTNEIRPSPSGVAGAEPVPQRNRVQETWYETDIDSNFTRDRGPETEDQLRQEQRAQGPGAMYINTYKEEQHNYENYENFKAQEQLQNPYEDEVATVHSEGVASQAPQLPPREGEEWLGHRMGDISEADERVQRFYGILPKEVKGEVKTPRMVKQASKKNSRTRRSGSGEEDSESLEVDSVDEEEPPPPLPRGNFTQMHNFLSNMPLDSPVLGEPSRGESVPRSNERTDNENLTNNNSNGIGVSPRRPSFKLGDMTSTSSRPPSRPGSSMSAHERLFGASREDSLSPDMSPVKSSSIASSDSQASSQAMMSPVFKSAAARAIIEEERKTPVQIIPKVRKKPLKKRHMTISGGQPAVVEALARHDANGRTRARDDMDMERMLKPRDAPDVVRSTYTGDPFRVENLFGLPEKISIPERYRTEHEEQDKSTPEERRTRLKKADSIRRMLAESQATPQIIKREGGQAGTMNEERKQREQILALSQVLARQVTEKSRMFAGQNGEVKNGER